MTSIAKELAKHPLLDKTWSTQKIATQAITRNGYSMDQITGAGYELRQPAEANGRWAICPMPKAEKAPRKAKAAKIEQPAPDTTAPVEFVETYTVPKRIWLGEAKPKTTKPKAAPTIAEAEVAYTEMAEHARTAEPTAAPEPHLEPEVAAFATDEQIETWMTERQASVTATIEPTAPQATFSLMLEEAFATLEQAEAWARDAAKKLRTIIRVRDASGTVIAEIGPQSPATRHRTTEGARSDTTTAMVQAMTTPGGITAEQIQQAGGWANRPALVHMDRWAAARGFKLHIHSGSGKKRYEAVFSQAAAAE